MAAPNFRAGPVELRSILSSRGLVHERNFQTKRVAHRLNCEAGRRSARAKVRLRTLGRWGGRFRRKPSLRSASSSVRDRVAARELWKDSTDQTVRPLPVLV